MNKSGRQIRYRASLAGLAFALGLLAILLPMAIYGIELPSSAAPDAAPDVAPDVASRTPAPLQLGRTLYLINLDLSGMARCWRADSVSLEQTIKSAVGEFKQRPTAADWIMLSTSFLPLGPSTARQSAFYKMIHTLGDPFPFGTADSKPWEKAFEDLRVIAYHGQAHGGVSAVPLRGFEVAIREYLSWRANQEHHDNLPNAFDKIAIAVLHDGNMNPALVPDATTVSSYQSAIGNGGNDGNWFYARQYKLSSLGLIVQSEPVIPDNLCPRGDDLFKAHLVVFSTQSPKNENAEPIQSQWTKGYSVADGKPIVVLRGRVTPPPMKSITPFAWDPLVYLRLAGDWYGYSAEEAEAGIDMRLPIKADEKPVVDLLRTGRLAIPADSDHFLGEAYLLRGSMQQPLAPNVREMDGEGGLSEADGLALAAYFKADLSDPQKLAAADRHYRSRHLQTAWQRAGLIALLCSVASLVWLFLGEPAWRWALVCEPAETPRIDLNLANQPNNAQAMTVKVATWRLESAMEVAAASRWRRWYWRTVKRIENIAPEYPVRVEVTGNQLDGFHFSIGTKDRQITTIPPEKAGAGFALNWRLKPEEHCRAIQGDPALGPGTLEIDYRVTAHYNQEPIEITTRERNGG